MTAQRPQARGPNGHAGHSRRASGRAALEAKARHKAEPAAANVVRAVGDSATVRFAKRQRALTPGQAIAFYSGQECLGGGTIRAASGLAWIDGQSH